MTKLDIRPFALPNCSDGEFRFEDVRDISRIVVRFKSTIPNDVGISYLKKYWPEVRHEIHLNPENPGHAGWTPIDDWFNLEWHSANVLFRKLSKKSIEIVFAPLTSEFPECSDYDVAFRRTHGIRIDAEDKDQIDQVKIYTPSPVEETQIEVFFGLEDFTIPKRILLEAHNACFRERTPNTLLLLTVDDADGSNGPFSVFHQRPPHPYCFDEGLITFDLDDEQFTISLESLKNEGPIWFAERGVFIKLADDETDFESYRAQCAELQTRNEMVANHPEQTLFNAYNAQPRPHEVNYNLGCKHNRQRFWLDANGDVVIHKFMNVQRVKGKDTDRFKCEGNGRFFFGLEKWAFRGRFPDPAPILAYNILAKKGSVLLEQKSLAVPLMKSILDGPLAGDDTVVGMFRFRFDNAGEKESIAEMPVRYGQNMERGPYSLIPPTCDKFDKLTVSGNRILGEYDGEKLLRCTIDSDMDILETEDGLMLRRRLEPGESCEALLKIPFIAIDEPEELTSLEELNFGDAYQHVRTFWQEEGIDGAQIHTPIEPLNALHKAHVSHVQITDFSMPDEPWLINTSVGSSTYGNFSNESCMIIQELDQRGLHEEARRRLELYVKYQSTAPQPGNFTDYDGMFFGAGGFEDGAYNQHHGWVLWRLCESFYLTGDREWFESVADKVVAGADWVFRQRRNTMTTLPHSRGWEYGFLPAGSLEDVTDFHYWLSTNSLTWRGTEWAARALDEIGHPEAERVRKEADAYRADLINGFNNMRTHSPLVRLRNGRWIPQFPSRLYRRGRDVGWIRQTLEGAVYLLISGLYDANSEIAKAILDDYQDNLYPKAPYGFSIYYPDHNWFNFAGFSMQPNLLAGLMPHLERDEPEIYIWMFFNSWASCYREEINAMAEHPLPVLGHSNAAQFKTSDEANAIMWLRYFFVYANDAYLHFGRAIPREWFKDGEVIGLDTVSTYYGDVGIRYESKGNTIHAKVKLELRKAPPKILVRFRHPEKRDIASVRVNGDPYSQFDAINGDVDITGQSGVVEIEVEH